MVLMALGVNHHTAPIEVRERLAFDCQAGILGASKLLAEGLVQEAVVISTCNRTELYCVGSGLTDPLSCLIRQSGIDYDHISHLTYMHSDLKAVAHLMRVASGLDSMIFGEGEILGQVKQAYTAAANAGTVGKHLGRLFQTTFAVAKEARTKTGIGINPVSVAYAAAKLSQHIFSDLTQVSVLLIGAGDLIRQTARHLSARGVKKIMVANRSEANALRLAELYGGEAFHLSKIPEHLAKADIVITGTPSALPILGKGLVESALRSRKRRPMFMVDLSVPRNIEPEIGELEDIYLYSIDDLQTMVEDNRRFRRSAAEQAEGIIEEAALQFMDWLQAQDSFKILSDFRKKFEQIRDSYVKASLHQLQLGENPEMILKHLAHRLTNRFLHEPTRRLREAGLEKEQELLNLTSDLFELTNEDIPS